MNETYFGHAPPPMPSIYERSIVAFSEHLARPEVQADPKRKKKMLDAIEAAAMFLAEGPHSAPVVKPAPLRATAVSSQPQTQVNGYECARCTHQWVPRSKHRTPKVCPRCKSPYWDRLRRSETTALFAQEVKTP